MPYIILSVCVLVALLITRAALGRVIATNELSVAFAQTIGARQINADVFEWSKHDGKTLLVLADGIGIGSRGRTAALAATDSIIRTFELQGLLANPAYFFRQAFHHANEAVLRYVPDGTAGANVLCALISDGLLYYALAGNCKAAVFRKSELIALSEGQTLNVLARDAFKRQMIRREEALATRKERRVYNYVGKDDFKELEIFDIPVRLKPGDSVIMMSDGVHEFCPTLDLENILRTGRSCQYKANAVVEQLNNKNDPQQDNATIIIGRVGRL